MKRVGARYRPPNQRPSPLGGKNIRTRFRQLIAEKPGSLSLIQTDGLGGGSGPMDGFANEFDKTFESGMRAGLEKSATSAGG